MSVIAHLKVPERFAVNPEMSEWRSLLSGVDTYGADVLPGVFPRSVPMPLWIGAKQARPHVDLASEWQGLWFVTLSLSDGYEFGDARQDKRLGTLGVYVPRGTMFVVQPSVPHWLFLSEDASPRTRPWYGLQWEVRPNQAHLVVLGLLKLWGGRIVPTVEPRYSNLAQRCGYGTS